jgi:hypothetical protein
VHAERLETGTKAREMDLVWLALRDRPVTDQYGFVNPNAAMCLYDHDLTDLSVATLNSLFVTPPLQAPNFQGITLT